MSTRISDLPAWARWGFLTAALAGAMVSLERGAAAQRQVRAFPPPLERPLPKGLTRQALIAALGGESRVAADLAYIECLQYIGGPWADGFYGRTLELYSEVQWLDPGFRHAVREGVGMLGWLLRRSDEALVLGQRAMADDPHEARYAAYRLGDAAAAGGQPLPEAGRLGPRRGLLGRGGAPLEDPLQPGRGPAQHRRRQGAPSQHQPPLRTHGLR